MVERIGKESALAREALRSALRAAGERALDRGPAAPAETSTPAGADFARALERGVAEVEDSVRAIEGLPQELIAGQVSDFHEIAVQIKDAELSFRFAMEIRNKLIDAYREIMRMTV